jgi:hypothetical protein
MMLELFQLLLWEYLFLCLKFFLSVCLVIMLFVHQNWWRPHCHQFLWEWVWRWLNEINPSPEKFVALLTLTHWLLTQWKRRSCVMVELTKWSLLDSIMRSLLFEIGSTSYQFCAKPSKAIGSHIFPVSRVNTAMFQRCL